MLAPWTLNVPAPLMAAAELILPPVVSIVAVTPPIVMGTAAPIEMAVEPVFPLRSVPPLKLIPVGLWPERDETLPVSLRVPALRLTAVPVPNARVEAATVLPLELMVKVAPLPANKV